jgi:hypothetical protein
MTYDSKCWDLANEFIDDHPELRPKAALLAQAIQEAIDRFIDNEE